MQGYREKEKVQNGGFPLSCPFFVAHMNQKTTHQTVLITGASKGLGLELARIFAENGYHLVLVARSASKLEKLANEIRQQFQVQVAVLEQDLSLPEGPDLIWDFTQAMELEIDILVNNAGFGEYGEVWNINPEREEAMIQLNIRALTRLTRLFLPPMLTRKRGKILNMASLAAFQPGPGMVVYFATKAFVLHYSEALAMELKGTGVTVTVFCPGPTKTDFEMEAHLEKSRLFKVLPVAQARPVAMAAYQSLMQEKVVSIDGILNSILAFSVRLFPRRVVRRVMVWILGKRD